MVCPHHELTIAHVDKKTTIHTRIQQQGWLGKVATYICAVKIGNHYF